MLEQVLFVHLGAGSSSSLPIGLPINTSKASTATMIASGESSLATDKMALSFLLKIPICGSRFLESREMTFRWTPNRALVACKSFKLPPVAKVQTVNGSTVCYVCIRGCGGSVHAWDSMQTEAKRTNWGRTYHQ